VNLAYWIVDAFTDRVFRGNPAAVVLPEEPLSTELMQSIAAENNLSETAFAVDEGGAYHLRWFTPTVEVDLCGHATLATSFVLAGRGLPGPFHFRTRSGELTARVTPGGIELNFPARTFEPLPSSQAVADAIGVIPLELLQSADLIAVLPSAAHVANLRPDPAAIRALPGGALIVTALGGEGADVTSRYFAPAYGIAEDPVTGSLHTQILPYWSPKLGKPRLICHQASARGGTMVATLDGVRVRMEGQAVLYASGTIFLT
jgi:PhzF family phenazine biosynthesis protein